MRVVFDLEGAIKTIMVLACVGMMSICVGIIGSISFGLYKLITWIF